MVYWILIKHFNEQVTWREVAMLSVVFVVLYYCKRRYIDIR